MNEIIGRVDILRNIGQGSLIQEIDFDDLKGRGSVSVGIKPVEVADATDDFVAFFQQHGQQSAGNIAGGAGQ